MQMMVLKETELLFDCINLLLQRFLGDNIMVRVWL